MKKYILAVLFAGVSANYVHAQHDAHTHGEAELNIAFDANQLIIELTSPAVNMVGFEHNPKNIEQQLETEKLIRAIQTPENFFAVPARCVLDAIDFESPFTEGDDLSRGDQEREEHHDEYAEEDSDHAHHDEAENEHKEESHQDIHITYEWQCSENKLMRIDVNLFKLYSGFEKIQAQWVVSGKQGAKLLMPTNASLRF